MGSVIFLYLFIVIIATVSGLSASASRRRENPSASTLGAFLGLFIKPNKGKLAPSTAMQAEILQSLETNTVPPSMSRRLQGSRDGTAPWIATLSPAELLITRSHGLRPVAAVSATCWMQYGNSWTEGHTQGWNTALQRLREEAKAAGANAVVDVKMRTIPMDIANSMDFTLVGTAVKVDGLPPSTDPVVSTVSALEFVKLLDANIIPSGIAVGAEFEWISDYYGGGNLFFSGNTECDVLSQLWERVRRQAHMRLRDSTTLQGNGALAHINFSQMFKREVDKQPNQYLARHIVIATVVDVPHVVDGMMPGRMNRQFVGSVPVTHWNLPQEPDTESAVLPDFQMVVDLYAGKTPLKGTIHQHQSYASNEQEGPI